MRNESCYRHTRDTNGLAIRKAVDWRSVDSLVDLLLPSPPACGSSLDILSLHFLLSCAAGWLWINLRASVIARLLLVAASVARGSRSMDLLLLGAGVALLYGGELLEVIRFMHPVAVDLEPGELEYVQRLAMAMAELERVPLVTTVSLFDKPANINETGVRVNLDTLCHWSRSAELCREML